MATTKNKKPAARYEHRDLLGQVIALDQYVAYSSSNSLYLGRVVKINPKMIGLADATGQRWNANYNKYPQDVVVVDAALATWYLLKQQPKR